MIDIFDLLASESTGHGGSIDGGLVGGVRSNGSPDGSYDSTGSSCGGIEETFLAGDQGDEAKRTDLCLTA